MGYKVNKIYVGTQQVRPAARLPSAYQEVEYIQSSGTQYIDTGIKLSDNLGWDVDFMELDVINGTGHCFLGGRYSAGNKEICISTYYYYSGGIVAFGTQNINPYIISNTRQQCSLRNRTFTACNGTINTFNSDLFDSDLPLYIFAMYEKYPTRVVDYANARIYRLSLYDSNTLVRDLVPCYRKSDNVIGLYDLVNNQFYTNSGSGTFSKGPDVN